MTKYSSNYISLAIILLSIVILLLITSTTLVDSLQKPTTSQTLSIISKTKYKSIILYDGVCNFCNKWVDLLCSTDDKCVFGLCALQSDTGKDLLTSIGKEKSDISTILLLSAASPSSSLIVYDKSNAILYIMKDLNLFYNILSKMLTLIPLHFRDFVYDNVAANRYNFLGKRDVCRINDNQGKYNDRFIP